MSEGLLNISIAALALAVSVFSVWYSSEAATYKRKQNRQLATLAVDVILLCDAIQTLIYVQVKNTEVQDRFNIPYLKTLVDRLQLSTSEAISLGLHQVLIGEKADQLTMFNAFMGALLYARDFPALDENWTKGHLLYGLARLAARIEQSRAGFDIPPDVLRKLKTNCFQRLLFSEVELGWWQKPVL